MHFVAGKTAPGGDYSHLIADDAKGRDDLLVMQSMGTYFQFDNLAGVDKRGRRHISPGEKFITIREHYKRYAGSGCDVLQGNPEAPVVGVQKPRSFTEKALAAGYKLLEPLTGGGGKKNKNAPAPAFPSAAESIRSEERHKCPICPGEQFTFRTDNGLDKHMSQYHWLPPDPEETPSPEEPEEPSAT